MVAGTRCLLALLLPQVLLGGAAGLIPELGRRKFAASTGRSSSQPSDDVLSEFELRLLSMFGLKQRPTPSRDAVVPPAGPVPTALGPAGRARPGPPAGEGSQPRQHRAQLPPRRIFGRTARNEWKNNPAILL